MNRSYSGMLGNFIAVALLTICFAPAQAMSSGPTSTLPSETDPHISSFNDPHVSWLPSGNARNQLLVFIPGTGGKPRENFPFAQTGADLGYHVISLMYPDGIAAQQKCARSDDPQAYTKFRLAIIQGGVIGPMMTINQSDSIENRLQKLLTYLAAKQPNAGWSQFLGPNGIIDWSKITVSGQSQGGGHAYMIGKIHKVDRVIMFGSPKDYSFFFNRPAQGFDGHTATPINRFFTFNHMRDNGNGCNHEQQLAILNQIGLTQLGTINADGAGTAFKHAHVIYTDAELPNDSNRFHGSVIDNRIPVCPTVWNYMLTEPIQ